jgi:hypothetical protein
MKDMKLDKFTCYRNLETTTIESACGEIEVAQLTEILKKYTAADDMFTGTYLHGTRRNRYTIPVSSRSSKHGVGRLRKKPVHRRYLKKFGICQYYNIVYLWTCVPDA